MLGGARKKHSLIGNTHHIYTAESLLVSETRRPPLTPQYCGRSSALQTKDLSELRNPDPLYMGIPAKGKRDTLSKRNQRIPRLN